MGKENETIAHKNTRCWIRWHQSIDRSINGWVDEINEWPRDSVERKRRPSTLRRAHSRHSIGWLFDRKSPRMSPMTLLTNRSVGSCCWPPPTVDAATIVDVVVAVVVDWTVAVVRLRQIEHHCSSNRECSPRCHSDHYHWPPGDDVDMMSMMTTMDDLRHQYSVPSRLAATLVRSYSEASYLTSSGRCHRYLQSTDDFESSDSDCSGDYANDHHCHFHCHCRQSMRWNGSLSMPLMVSMMADHSPWHADSVRT